MAVEAAVTPKVVLFTCSGSELGDPSNWIPDDQVLHRDYLQTANRTVEGKAWAMVTGGPRPWLPSPHPRFLPTAGVI